MVPRESKNWVIPAAEEKEHSLLSPSSAHRWMRCPGAPHLEATLKEEVSIPAEEGTAAHFVAEKYLSGDDFPCMGDMVTTPAGLSFEVTKEMVDALKVYFDAVREMEVELGSEVLVEKRGSLFPGVVEGTADAIVIGDDEAKVNDLKYGQGVDVDAEDSEQGSLYALAVLKDCGFTSDAEIEILITQPRHFKSEKVRRWVTTWGYLETWRDFELEPAVDRAMAATKEGPFNPSDEACKFCKAAKQGACPAINAAGEITASTLGVEPPMQMPEDVEQYSPDQLATVLSLEAAYKLWKKAVDAKFAAVKARAKSQLESGFTVPGYKRVNGRKSAAKWADEAEVVALAEMAGIDPYSNAVKTVAKLRDEFKENGIDVAPLLEFSTYTQGIDVVPESNKKKALPPKIEPEELFE